MKKHIFILSVIFLKWSIGIASNSPIPSKVIFKVDTCYSSSQEYTSEEIRYIKGYILEGWFGTKEKTNDSIKWLNIADMNSNIASIIEQAEKNAKQIQYLWYVVIGLAALLMFLLFYICLVLNNRKRLRDRLLYVLTGKKIENESKSRLDIFKEDITNEVVELLKATTYNSSESPKSNDNEIVCAINELRKSIVALNYILNNYANLHSLGDSPNEGYEPKVELNDKINSNSPTIANLQQPTNQPTKKFADSIVDGKFNKVTDQPNSDTVFELQLETSDDMSASIIVYETAYDRVIARPAFLDGCEKQILGNTKVVMQSKGIAIKDDNGKWIVKIKPGVRII